MENWHISRQYIAQDKIVTEYWNRDLQQWQDKQGGKGYTLRGVHANHRKLYRLSLGLHNLCVTSYRAAI